MKLLPLLIVMGSICLTACAQLALKVASARHIKSDDTGWLQSLMAQLFDPLTISAIGMYVGSLILWLLALRSLPLSLAYPMSGLTIAIVTFLGWMTLGEQLGVQHFAGIALILIGVLMLAQTGG